MHDGTCVAFGDGMRRTISYKGHKHVYDTEKSEEVGEPHYFGSYGDPDGYEEHLYRTKKNGLYFRYGIGGPKSEYGTEGSIFTMSAKEAKHW